MLIRIEEALANLPGIKRITSTANEGSGTVSVELEAESDLDLIQNQVKTRVDAIPTLPELAEKPVIERFEAPIPVIFISIFGDMDEYARKQMAQQVKDGLLTLPGVNDVQTLGERDYEISIEVSQAVLEQYGTDHVRDCCRRAQWGTGHPGWDD